MFPRSTLDTYARQIESAPERAAFLAVLEQTTEQTIGAMTAVTSGQLQHLLEQAGLGSHFDHLSRNWMEYSDMRMLGEQILAGRDSDTRN